MRPLLLLATLALLLAGCADKSHGHSVTCDDGTTREYGDDALHHDETFDPMELCAPPPLVVRLTGLPETMEVHRSVEVTFDLPLEGRDHGHSMDSQVRVATEPGAPTSADLPDSYGSQVGRREHQDLPLTFTATFTPDTPGTYYLRAAALVDGATIWTNATAVEVLPVAPTGDVWTVVHGAGAFLGEVGPTDVQAQLGDALVFSNEDVIEHVFTFTSGPLSGTEVTVAAGAMSEPILLDVPAAHEISSDDLNAPASITVRVTAA